MTERNAAGKWRPGEGARGPYGKTMRPVGSEYVGKDGYVMVKTAMWPTKAGGKDNWKPKHRHVWEQANGREVPKGWVVMFKNRDARDFDPANLEAVPRGVMQRMNSLVGEDPALAWRDAETFEAVRLMAEVSMAARRADLARARRCGVCGRSFVPDLCRTKGTVNAKNAATCRACLDAGRLSRPRKGER